MPTSWHLKKSRIIYLKEIGKVRYLSVAWHVICSFENLMALLAFLRPHGPKVLVVRKSEGFNTTLKGVYFAKPQTSSTGKDWLPLDSHGALFLIFVSRKVLQFQNVCSSSLESTPVFETIPRTRVNNPSATQTTGLWDISRDSAEAWILVGAQFRLSSSFFLPFFLSLSCQACVYVYLFICSL